MKSSQAINGAKRNNVATAYGQKEVRKNLEVCKIRGF
jgi:hypothetical protein